MPAINTYDIIFCAIGAIFMILGAWRGLLSEAIRLLAVLSGFSAAMIWYGDLYPHLKFLPTSPPTTTAIAFVVIFAGSAAVVLIAGWAVRKIIHLTVLGWMDLLFGALLGAIKALILIWVFILSINSSPFASIRKSLRGSRVYTTLTSLPPSLTVPSFIVKPGSIEQMITGPVRTLEQTRKKIENLKHQVDSVKAEREDK